MMIAIHHSRRVRTRRGTTTVEAAFVLPIFFFFIFALIEIGHAQMVMNVLNSACRSGARLGSTEGTSTSENGNDFAALPDVDLMEIESRKLFMVHASVQYNDIALVPMPFMNGVVLDAQAFIRHE